MHNNCNILAIIPARGGSKGLPRKNIYQLKRKPLIAYTIEASLNSKYITKTVVSSEDDEILEVSKRYGAEIIKRPYVLATDSANSQSVIKDTINQLIDKGESFDIVVLLQPTSPLRDFNDIDSAIQKMLDKNAEGVISVINIGVKPFKSYYLNDKGYLSGVFNDSAPNMRRQELPDAYLANGAIYGVYVNNFLETNSLIPSQTIPFVMSTEKSLDVDTIEDIRKCEAILSGNDLRKLK